MNKNKTINFLKKLSDIKHGWALFIVDFILPIPLTILIIFLWYNRCHNWTFTIYIITLPFLFGYIVPGIGTNVLKMWTFKWNIMRIGNYFYHHGFMYAPYFALSLYLTWGSFEVHLTSIKIITIVISNTFLQCFLTTWHDYWAVKSGMIEIYNKPFKDGKSAAEIILDYGPIAYAMFGCTYAISCVAAQYFIYKATIFTLANFILLIVIGLILMGIPGLHYYYREKKNIY